MFQFGFFDEPKKEEKKPVLKLIPTSLVKLSHSAVYPKDVQHIPVNIKQGVQLKKRKFSNKESLLQEISDSSLKDAVSDVDVRNDVYEGGFKIWESTIDMCQLLIEKMSNELVGKRVLDLGCGHGFVNITALKLGCEHAVFQDLNADVLKVMTAANLGLNDVLPETTSLVAGDWRSPGLLNMLLNAGVQQSTKFDFIFTCETIYREDCYESLCKVLENCLSRKGFCFVGGKRFYFGVGGSMDSFVKYVKNRNLFNVEVVWSLNEGVSRDIIKLTWKS